MPTIYQTVTIKSLQRAKQGAITLYLPDGEAVICGEQTKDAPQIEFRIHNLDTFRQICLRKGIGLGESYQLGYWSSNNLTALLEWFCVNLRELSANITPTASVALSTLAKVVDTIGHWKNRNTIEQSEKNIHAHYDLGNEFYNTFLDPSLTYSSAFFASEAQTLEEAQAEKYDRICRKLDLQPDHHLLEIGCGWGGFALHAAKRYGCKITGITISKEQFAEATRRVAEANMESQISIEYADYRTLEGKFDRIASIEMLEAVGEKFLDGYFTRVEELLAPNGLAAVQVITTPNPLYEKYRNSVDWIQKHIFPGSHLPSSRRLLKAAEIGQLDLLHQETFGLHYAKTLAQWRLRFLESWPQIEKQGFDKSFKHKWEFYLAYCEAGFRQRHINVMQMVFGRADEESYDFEERTHTASRHNSTPALVNAS
ncbi:SAM-dependent methyltransferase [Pelagicoccus mobilis]|uniref:Class I SAM-dependent methyltransferase n=1 Tax=Pelagicoccus mobilis TaxID=415221 RepID=A0A934S2P9_9BACT|nr:cyclopropane-fatty-acyl-phospholipid synthase family protein [Pelagicoccus mobilis]MBK1880095.1 class I SAM-dependent methyltransferase [Pelagicoccus mobilis]